MTLNEFKAWLEGYEASFDGAPDGLQWKKIKEKLETVTPIQAPYPYTPNYPIWTYVNGVPTTANNTLGIAG